MTKSHVLLTGSTRGIHAAILRQLEARGARVVGHGKLRAGVRSNLGPISPSLEQPKACGGKRSIAWRAASAS